MNQIHLNTIKLCIFIALLLFGSVVFFIFYSNYSSMQKVETIKEEITTTIAEYKENKPKEPIHTEEEVIIEKRVLNEEIVSLKTINEDTVGWLKVNNTNVDYPVVQAKDNDYYLTNNFKKQHDTSGWIFMDYRANPENLSDNTIIFGHNMFYSGVMFGTLYKTKYSDWYLNPENQIIEFDNINKKMKWKIFSIYNIPNTNDYLISDFSTTDKFQEFLDFIINRSIYNFNTPVSNEDKILTLSTCSNNGTYRLVIHAVLLDD